MYISLKARRGNMFFLPLPIHKTMETLGDVSEVALSNPDLYIIVNVSLLKTKWFGAVWMMSTTSR